MKRKNDSSDESSGDDRKKIQSGKVSTSDEGVSLSTCALCGEQGIFRSFLHDKRLQRAKIASLEANDGRNLDMPPESTQLIMCRHCHVPLHPRCFRTIVPPPNKKHPVAPGVPPAPIVSGFGPHETVFSCPRCTILRNTVTPGCPPPKAGSTRCLLCPRHEQEPDSSGASRSKADRVRLSLYFPVRFIGRAAMMSGDGSPPKVGPCWWVHADCVRCNPRFARLAVNASTGGLEARILRDADVDWGAVTIAGSGAIAGSSNAIKALKIFELWKVCCLCKIVEPPYVTAANAKMLVSGGGALPRPDFSGSGNSAPFVSRRYPAVKCCGLVTQGDGNVSDANDNVPGGRVQNDVCMLTSWGGVGELPTCPLWAHPMCALLTGRWEIQIHSVANRELVVGVRCPKHCCNIANNVSVRKE
eukprot:GHVL01022330.1.p1 GENE.GHVL01022330.1~~GHVL01022330.1.p1  ORF type:complete len:415 (+),score=69.88 GHVL01022330.1:20-1264(+)